MSGAFIFKVTDTGAIDFLFMKSWEAPHTSECS